MIGIRGTFAIKIVTIRPIVKRVLIDRQIRISSSVHFYAKILV